MRSIKEATKLRWFLRVLISLFLFIGLYLVITFFQVFYYARNDQVSESTKADAIVVLGAAQYNGRPSPVLKARLEHALDLFNRGVAPKLIVTGGNQDGDDTTEASASADYLLSNGVEDSEILREVQSKSTFESIRDVSVIAEERGISKLVLVTDGFHQLRTKLIAESYGFEVISSKVPNSPISGSQEARHFISETGRVSLGRIIGFRRVSRDSQIGEFVQERSKASR